MASEKTFVRIVDPDLEYLLSVLYVQKKSLKKLEDETKKTLAKVKATVKPFLEDTEADGVQVGSLRALVSHGRRSTLQREQLLARGVAPDVIADCTKVSTYESLKVEAVDETEGQV